MEYIRKKYIILPKVILFFAILFLIAGCGPYIIKPDYENELYQSEELKRDKIKIVKVVDARTDYLPEKVAGTARVGLLNQFKVPYKLNTSVKDFVDQSIHKITGESIKEKFVNPITVYIDKFSVREDYNMIISGGYFNCDFRFCYPVTRDSFQTIEASSRKSTKNILDITGSLDELIYSGIFDCTKFFLKEYDKTNKHYIPNIKTLSENFVYSIPPIGAYAPADYWAEQPHIDSLSENSVYVIPPIRAHAPADNWEEQPGCNKNRFFASLGFSAAIHYSEALPLIGITGSAGIKTLDNLLRFGIDGTILGGLTSSDYLLDAFVGICSTLRPISGKTNEVYIKGGLYRFTIPDKYKSLPRSAKSFGLGFEAYHHSEDGSYSTFFMEIMFHYVDLLEEDPPDMQRWFPLITMGKRF